jgi:predicted unusual protein kinase regulating ubiquinone biosynthesis (AarF/ABC1/UbiB family)
MILKTKHMSRYTQIGRLFWRHGRSDLFRQLSDLGDLKEQEFDPEDKPLSPDDLVLDLEKMGPTFVKLGQILSSRADLLPEPYLRALSRLQDKVEPFPYADVERIVQEELGRADRPGGTGRAIVQGIQRI